MKKENHLPYTLNLSESILLMAFFMEAGVDAVTVVVEIDNSLTGTPFEALAKKISEARTDSNLLVSGDLFLQAAQKTEDSEEKAFFSLLAVAQLSGMTISDKLKWMAEIFRRPVLLSFEEKKKRNDFLIQKISPFANRVGCDFDAWKEFFQSN